MIKQYLRAVPFLALYFFIFCSQTYASCDTIPKWGELKNRSYPIYFLDEKEIDLSILKKIDPTTIAKIENIKSESAIKTFGVRARFGAVKITSRKKQVYNKAGIYQLTLYITKDGLMNVQKKGQSGSNLDSLFYRIIKEYPNSNLIIDELRFINQKGDNTYLEIESSAFNLVNSSYSIDSVSASVAEIIFYGSKPYKSGRFYFSGNNFRNVISCSATDMNCIQTNIRNCTIGTIITLEACQYRNPNNTNEVINKVIKLD